MHLEVEELFVLVDAHAHVDELYGRLGLRVCVSRLTTPRLRIGRCSLGLVRFGLAVKVRVGVGVGLGLRLGLGVVVGVGVGVGVRVS